MERNIQPGDIVFVTTRHQITVINDGEIIFRTERGEDVAVFNANSGKYFTRDGEITGFEAAPQIINPPIAQPIAPVTRPMYIAQPIAPVTRPMYTPIPVGQTVVPQPIMSPKTPKVSKKFRFPTTLAEDFPPQVIEPGQTGFISGLGVQYDEAGERVRSMAKYRFRVLRLLRKGSNVILELDDGGLSTLTIRWRTNGNAGRGWVVRYKQGSFDDYHPVFLEFD